MVAAAEDGELLTAMAMLSAMAASHMTMPHFWLPYTIVGRAQGWSLQYTLLVGTSSMEHVLKSTNNHAPTSSATTTTFSSSLLHVFCLALMVFGFLYSLSLSLSLDLSDEL
jgi:hypothetical protein